MTSSAIQILVGTVMLGVCVGLMLLIVKTAHGMGLQAAQQADQSSSVASSPTPSGHITSGGSKPAAEAAAKPSATTAVAGPTAANVPSPRTITVMGTLSHPRSPAPAPVRPPKPRPVPVRSTVPAPSPVPVTQTPTFSTFTFNAPPLTVVQSAPRSLPGRLTPGGGRVFNFQKLISGTWRTIYTGRTNPSGYAPGNLQTKVAGVAKYRFYGPATSHYGGRYSNVVTITVRPGLTAGLSRATIAKDQTGASLAGKAFPAASGRTIYLQGYYSGMWHNMTYTHTNVDGTYGLALPTTTVGVANYRAYMTKASASRPASITSTLTFTVLPWTSALCGGDILAISHVNETAATATLVGTVTNQTGFDVDFSDGYGPIVDAFDTNGDNVRLTGIYSSNLNLLHPGQSLNYQSPRTSMLTPDRPWSDFWFHPLTQFHDDNVVKFCIQREVPSVQILR